ncbi:hypothetical protein KCU90_g11065, partial [Aureobasidium melanogenum]
FFHSTGADKLVSKAGPMKASVSSNGADWHVGVLKFSKTKEDWFFSSVYIEDGELTTSISASGGDAPAKASSAPAASSSSTAAVSSKAPIVAPPSSAAAAQTTSSKAASSSATTVKSSASAVPTTLQTMTKPTSSAASVISSTAAAETAPSATDDAGCTVDLGINTISTYGHSQLRTGHPVRSAIHKQLNGRLVLRWVTTWESLLLYVLPACCGSSFLLSYMSGQGR